MLFKVTVNGKVHIVDAATKASAKSHGAAQLEVTVEPAGPADLQGLDIAAIPVVRPTPKTPKAEGEAAAA